MLTDLEIWKMFRSRLRGKRGAYKLEDGKGEERIQHET